jgi:hypothetical protein
MESKLLEFENRIEEIRGQIEVEQQNIVSLRARKRDFNGPHAELWDGVLQRHRIALADLGTKVNLKRQLDEVEMELLPLEKSWKAYMSMFMKAEVERVQNAYKQEKIDWISILILMFFILFVIVI